MSDDATKYGPPVPAAVAVGNSAAETDIVEHLRNRAFRLAARDFNGDGASLAKDAADEILRLRALLRMQSKANAEHIKVAQAEITKLRAELAEARNHAEALDQKLDALGCESCACSYDHPDDVCAGHSPALVKLKAELAEAEAVIKPFASDCPEWPESDNGDHPMIAHHTDDEAFFAQFTIGDLRKAAAWLEGRKG